MIPGLTTLDLSENDLGDVATIKLCKSMKKHNSLHTLILDHNRITDVSCKSIGKLEANAYSLKELSLYWNLIQGPGACEILTGIQENFGIKVLNLGWNMIGNFMSNSFADKLAIVLKDENLIHLDICHNSIKENTLLIIEQALYSNHSLFGLHVDGNECVIDSIGFMISGENHDIKASEMHLIMGPGLLKNKKARSQQNHCWICEGWSEKCFKFNNSISMNRVH